MMPDLKRYRSSFLHSYCLGVFPTLELLHHQPELCLGVILHSKGSQNTGWKKILHQAQQQQIEIIENDHLVNKLANRGNTYAVGVFQKQSGGLQRDANHLTLVHPSGMGNLGTIMRTMIGFGFQNLALIEPAADPFHPKTVRASMGAVFQIQIAGFDSFPDYWGSFASHNLYPLMTNGAVSLPKAEFSTPYTLIFGEESSGLGDEYRQFGTSVKIPQKQAVDSFNLAISVGITLYQASSKNQIE